MGMLSMIPAVVAISCLCSSGVSASGIGIREIKSFTKRATWQLCCCIILIMLVSAGGAYAVVQSP